MLCRTVDTILGDYFSVYVFLLPVCCTAIDCDCNALVVVTNDGCCSTLLCLLPLTFYSMDLFVQFRPPCTNGLVGDECSTV